MHGEKFHMKIWINCKSLLYFESVFSYFIGMKLYEIMTLNCHPYLQRKTEMQETRLKPNTKFTISKLRLILPHKYRLQAEFLSA